MVGDQANARCLKQHMLAALHRPGSELTPAAFSHLALISQCEEHCLFYKVMMIEGL